MYKQPNMMRHNPELQYTDGNNPDILWIANFTMYSNLLLRM